MNDDELKRLWRGKKFDPSGLPDSELVSRMKSKLRTFHHEIFWRDVREVVACAIVFAWSAYEFARYPAALCRAGNVVLMLASTFIPWKMITARRAVPQVSGSAPTNDFIRAEIGRVSEQARLLNSVFWWYLLPLFVGTELCAIGRSRDPVDLVASLFVVVPVFGFVLWLNRYAARKGLLPLKQELEHVLDPENVPAPAPGNEYRAGGLRLRIKLCGKTFEFPQESPLLVRFFIAMNCFWVTLPCSMLKSADIPRETFPGPLAIVCIAAFGGLLFLRLVAKKAEFSFGKILALGIAALTGLLALAWGFNILRVLLT